MEQLTPTFPNLIRSLDKLKILLFWEILKTKNPYLLDGDYMPDKQYTEEEASYIVQQWEIMYDSYFQLKNDGKSKVVLDKAYELMLLAHKINQLQKNIDFCGHLKEFQNILPKEDYTDKEQMLIKLFTVIEPTLQVKYLDGMDANIAIVNKRISALQNKYNRTKEQNDKDVEKQVDNVFSVLVRVSQTLNIQLNAEKMMVTEWLEWEKIAKEKLKAQEEARRKKKK